MIRANPTLPSSIEAIQVTHLIANSAAGPNRPPACVCSHANIPLLINPVNAAFVDRHADLACARASAAMFQMYVFHINGLLAGGNGYSQVIDPAGRLLHDGNVQEEMIPLEVDFAEARRQRERGILNMGQPLKSFRDSPARFPIYEDGYRSDYLDSLGPLQKAQRLR